MTQKQRNIVKLAHGGFVDLDNGQAHLNLQVPFGASLAVPAPTAEVLSAMASFAAAPRSLQVGDAGGINPGLQQTDVFPNEQTDYIYPKFRALSAVLVPGYFIDFSKDTVLKDALKLFAQQTLYCDHIYWRAREWVGVVNQVAWDDKADSAGAPGINTEMKVDWRKAPDIARGLLMKPPAVKSVSATVDFEWDASHPELLEKRIFWQSLGENIDGHIVRMIVTKITGVYEVSFVYRGANPGSNELLVDDEEADSELSERRLSAPPKKPLELVEQPKEKTVKLLLTDPQKQAFKTLGLVVPEGDDVPDAIVQGMVDALTVLATSADGIVSAQRAEVLRLATLAEGVGEGDTRKLAPAIATLIEKADASQLPDLTTMYQAKAEAQFSRTCQSCGSKQVAGRSSVESAEEGKGDLSANAAEEDTHLL